MPRLEATAEVARRQAVRAWRLLRTRRPRTFNEKVRYKMLRDHRPVLGVWADKAAAREWIAGVVGAQRLPACCAVLDDAGGLPEVVAAGLPQAYVVKPTHGSGCALLVHPGAPADAVLPDPAEGWTYREVRPEAVDPEHLARLGAAWLEHRHGGGPDVEWAYSSVPPRILVEELVRQPDGRLPADTKLFVFDGRCAYVQVVTDRFGAHAEDFFSPTTWEHLPLRSGPLPWADPRPARPERLAEVVELAERLGAGIDFVRVDLYVLPDRVVVGELTSYPAAGEAPFEPPAFDLEFGRRWTVPRRYR